MITTIIFILVWFFANILILRFFYVSNPPQKVKTVYVGLNREEWKAILKCIDQCAKTGLRSEKEVKQRKFLKREVEDQVKNYISFEPK